MKAMMLRMLTAGLLAASTIQMPARAEDKPWWPYENPRFGFVVQLPPGLLVAQEADNGDGVTFTSADGRANILIWGTSVAEGDFAAEADDRRNTYAYVDGWDISYEKTTEHWASMSGTKGDRILYVRGIELCDGQAAFFQITYPQTASKAYDAVVTRIVETLKPVSACGQ